MRRLLVTCLLLPLLTPANGFVPSLTQIPTPGARGGRKRSISLVVTKGQGGESRFMGGDRPPRELKRIRRPPHPEKFGDPLGPNNGISLKITQLAVEGDVDGLLTMLHQDLESLSDSHCAFALCRLGDMVKGSPGQRAAVVQDSRFVALLEYTMALLPSARSTDVTRVLSAFERLRYRPSEPHLSVLMSALTTKPSALEGRSAGYVMQSLTTLRIDPDQAFLDAFCQATRHSLGSLDTWMLPVIVKGMGFLSNKVYPGPGYMAALYQEVESMLAHGDYTTIDLERLLDGLSSLTITTTRSPRPLLPPPTTLITTASRATIAKLKEFHLRGLVKSMQALSHLPGTPRTAEYWNPIRDEFHARVSDLGGHYLNEILRVFFDITYLPGPAFLHDCAVKCLLPTVETLRPQLVVYIVRSMIKLHLPAEDARLIMKKILPVLEGQVSRLPPQPLSWLVVMMYRLGGQPSPAMVKECMACVERKMLDIPPGYYSGILHTLLGLRDSPVPASMLRAIAKAVSRPGLRMDGPSVSLLLNCCVRISERVRAPHVDNSLLAPLLLSLIEHHLPPLVASLEYCDVAVVINSLARLGRLLPPPDPPLVTALADAATAHLRSGHLQGQSLILTLHGLARLGYFTSTRSQTLDDFLAAITTVLPKLSEASLAALTSALGYLSTQGHRHALAPAHLLLSRALAAKSPTGHYTPTQLSRVFNTYSHLGSTGVGDPFIATFSVVMARGAASRSWSLRALVTGLRAFLRLRYDPGPRVMEELQEGVRQRLGGSRQEEESSMSSTPLLAARLRDLTLAIRELGYMPMKELVDMGKWPAVVKGKRKKGGKASGDNDRVGKDVAKGAPLEDHDEEGEEGDAEEEDWHLRWAQEEEEGEMVVLGGEGSKMGPRQWGELGGRGIIEDDDDDEEGNSSSGQGSSIMEKNKVPETSAR